ncbi:hypothetical protein GTO36_09755, partial [bacterium]|nr:hypothetical protein [bacterium]
MQGYKETFIHYEIAKKGQLPPDFDRIMIITFSKLLAAIYISESLGRVPIYETMEYRLAADWIVRNLKSIDSLSAQKTFHRLELSSPELRLAGEKPIISFVKKKKKFEPCHAIMDEIYGRWEDFEKGDISRAIFADIKKLKEEYEKKIRNMVSFFVALSLPVVVRKSLILGQKSPFLHTHRLGLPLEYIRFFMFGQISRRQ